MGSASPNGARSPCTASALSTFRASGPVRPVTAFASVSEAPPWRHAKAKSCACGSLSFTPSCVYSSCCSSEQLLAQQEKLEGLLRLVVIDHRWNVAETLPAPKDRAPAGPRLLAPPDAAERGDDRGVAYLLLGRVQELIGRGEGIAWIPEHRPVAEESDRRLAAVVAVVLDEQINSRLTERDVVGRIIVPPERRRIDAERMLGMLHLALGQHQPCLLTIDDRSRQYPAHMTCPTEDKDRRSAGDQELALFHEQPAGEFQVKVQQRRAGVRRNGP